MKEVAVAVSNKTTKVVIFTFGSLTNCLFVKKTSIQT